MATENTCYLDASCNFGEKPIESILTPISHAFTTSINGVTLDFSILAIWGLILGILYMRTHNPMLVGVVGVFLVVILQSQLPSEGVVIGYILVGVSIGIALYNLVIKKIK